MQIFVKALIFKKTDVAIEVFKEIAEKAEFILKIRLNFHFSSELAVRKAVSLVFFHLFHFKFLLSFKNIEKIFTLDFSNFRFLLNLGWAPTKPMSVSCRKTDTILSVFVGFSLPTQTDTHFFRNRHGVGFLSVFCRFDSRNLGEFDPNSTQILRINKSVKLIIFKAILCFPIFRIEFSDGLNKPKSAADRLFSVPPNFCSTELFCAQN